MQPQSGQWIGTLITMVMVAGIMALRWRAMGKARPLKLERMWIAPAIYIAVVTLLLLRVPPHGVGWLYCLVALTLGAVLGWYRGRMVAIAVDPVTHRLSQTPSRAAMLFIIAIVGVRIGVRALAVEMHVGHEALLLLMDVAMAFALGLLPVQRLEMAIRARRLLGAARGAA